MHDTLSQVAVQVKVCAVRFTMKGDKLLAKVKKDCQLPVLALLLWFGGKLNKP